MAKNRIAAYRQLNGSFGKLWWDGLQVFEVESFSLKLTPNREDVPMDGLSIDSKIVSVKAEGNFKVRKVFSRGLANLLNAWKSGKDPRSTLVASIEDPDAFGAERVSVSNVWFNEIDFFAFEKGQKLEKEYSFGTTLDDIELIDEIEVK